MQLTPLRRSPSAGHQAAGGATGVTGTYFGVLGIDAFIGRTILPEDDVSPGSHAVGMLDHPRAVVFDQAENRLHAQKAILAALFS